MTEYLLISSRDPSEAGDAPYFYGLASDLAENGHSVTLFLVQNAVLPARYGAKADGIEEAIRRGVTVLADEFALRERGIPVDRLISGVRPAPLDVVIDRMVEGCKAIWH
jgi:predicted peroxiredoxin